MFSLFPPSRRVQTYKTYIHETILKDFKNAPPA